MQTNKPTLRCTKDYDMFEPHALNRDLHNRKNLTESMREYGFDPGFPIRCVRNGNGLLKITSGHNRFHTARELGLSVWFVVSPQDMPLFDAEASGKSWSVKDYTIARSREGDPAAIAAKTYHDRTGIPIGICISLVGGESGGSGNKQQQMKRGTFKVGDTNHAEVVEYVVLELLENGVDFANQSLFVNAISKCLRLSSFDVQEFLHKARTHSHLFVRQRNLDNYLDMIQLVYNRQRKKDQLVPLAFMAKKAAMQRKLKVCTKRSA